MTAQSAVQIRRASERAATDLPWLRSRHSFSFGDHYDPANTHHGLLLVNNDDVVAPGAGFDTHPHRDAEIVTWVLSGSLVHQDSTGHSGVIYPGLAQRMSAGRGIMHSEKNDAVNRTGGTEHTAPVHFVQMWVMPDESGREPSYQQAELDEALFTGRLATIASGMPAHRDTAAIAIGNRHAAFHVARLGPGESIVVPEAPYVHLYLATGAASLEGAPNSPLERGDAVRFTDSGGRRLYAAQPAEVLVWEMHARLGA